MNYYESLLRRFRKKEILGMDIGASGVRFVRLIRGAHGIALGKKWIYPSAVTDDPASLDIFRGYLQQEGLAGSAVACNIDHASLKIRKVDLPNMGADDLQEAVAWKMRDVVEGAIENYIVRHSSLEEYVLGESRRVSVLAYAIEKQAVAERCALLKNVGLEVEALEPTAVALLAAFEQGTSWEKDKLFALMDIGKSKTLFIVVGSGKGKLPKLLFSRPLEKFSVSEIEKSLTDKIVLAEFYTQLAMEVQRSLDAFSLLFGPHQVETLCLCGGGALLPELVTHLTNSLGIKTNVINPLARWNVPVELGQRLVAATGLALYG